MFQLEMCLLQIKVWRIAMLVFSQSFLHKHASFKNCLDHFVVMYLSSTSAKGLPHTLPFGWKTTGSMTLLRALSIEYLGNRSFIWKSSTHLSSYWCKDALNGKESLDIQACSRKTAECDWHKLIDSSPGPLLHDESYFFTSIMLNYHSTTQPSFSAIS